MIGYIYNIINSTDPRKAYLKLLLLLAILFICLVAYRMSERPKALEGFTQNQPYILKVNQDIYDDTYAELYDGVNERNKICQKELFKVINMTEPDSKNSVFLDIGCGTGCVVNELTNAGYVAYGIDKSDAMTNYAEEKYPNIIVLKSDFMDPMNYENNTFTHILCLNFTIYEVEDKLKFFRNCYHWMKPNSYFILHLVDREKFSSKKFLDSPANNSYAELYKLFAPQKPVSRETAITVHFEDYKYSESYEFSKDSNVLFKQIFVDTQTENIRENQQELKMETINEILSTANRAGFIVHSKSDMKSCSGDENQFLYVFERSM